MSFETDYPTLNTVIHLIDNYLKITYPDFFESTPQHPHLKLKPYKVIHDNLWGTNQFSWCELALIDSPIMQRLRDIHQVGLAFYVYPSARHTRFEHCLGTTIIASRVFDALLQREQKNIKNIAQETEGDLSNNSYKTQWRQDLRFAALLHDTGHSLFSHASEQVYKDLNILKKATEELTSFVGKKKGEGEVISFCIARTDSIHNLITYAKRQLLSGSEYDPEPDLNNVSLLIVGRSKHPFLQFIGDILSSGFDCDKLDYLLRDAIAAGLPLRYDMDRYLYSVQLEKEKMVDGAGELKKFYTSISTKAINRHEGDSDLPYYEAYRLRLPREAMNTIEQIVICKLMLFSYIYHHTKCRAAEGMLVKMLKGVVEQLNKDGKDDKKILEIFLNMTDSTHRSDNFCSSSDLWLSNYKYRLINRLLPREVYRIGGAIASASDDRAIIADFIYKLQDPDYSDKIITEIEQKIGEQLIATNSSLGITPQQALESAGVWFDVPKIPKIEDIHDLVTGRNSIGNGIELADLFPIDEWTQAYTHYRYYVRIFAFSEHWEEVKIAAKKVFQVTAPLNKIKDNSFYEKAQRNRL